MNRKAGKRSSLYYEESDKAFRRGNESGGVVCHVEVSGFIGWKMNGRRRLLYVRSI